MTICMNVEMTVAKASSAKVATVVWSFAPLIGSGFSLSQAGRTGFFSFRGGGEQAAPKGSGDREGRGTLRAPEVLHRNVQLRDLRTVGLVYNPPTQVCVCVRARVCVCVCVCGQAGLGLSSLNTNRHACPKCKQPNIWTAHPAGDMTDESELG